MFRSIFKFGTKRADRGIGSKKNKKCATNRVTVRWSLKL